MKGFLSLVCLAAAALISAWGLMIVVGIVHADWIPALPMLGFGTALTITSVTAIFGAVTTFLSELVGALVSDR